MRQTKNKSKKLKTFTFTEEVFGVKFMLLLGDKLAANLYLTKKYNLYEDAIPQNLNGCHFYITNKKDIIERFIWMENWEWYPEEMGTLIHEISHLTDRIFESMGIEIVDTELRAYYLDFWCVKIIKKLNQWTKNKN